MALEESNTALIIDNNSNSVKHQQQHGRQHQQDVDWDMESVDLDGFTLSEEDSTTPPGLLRDEESLSSTVDQLLNCSLEYFEGLTHSSTMSNTESTRNENGARSSEEDSTDNLIVESVEIFENHSSPSRNSIEVHNSDELLDNQRNINASVETVENMPDSVVEVTNLSDEIVSNGICRRGLERCEGNSSVESSEPESLNPASSSDSRSEENSDEMRVSSSSLSDTEKLSGRLVRSCDQVTSGGAPAVRGDSTSFDDYTASTTASSDEAASPPRVVTTLRPPPLPLVRFGTDLPNLTDECKQSVVISEDVTSADPSELVVQMCVPELKHDCLKNPLFISLANDLEDSRHMVTTLQETVHRLENQLSVEKSQGERISLLEQRIAQQERELQLGRQEHDLDLRTIATLRKEMETKLDVLKKQYEKANKDKEAMVMRYVTSEKELIDRKKEREVLEKKLKEQQKENETVSNKLKNVTADKVRISQLVEQKTSELTVANKEIEKLKEEINSREIKIKWVQNRIKTEIDAHKDCPEKIESLTLKVQQLEEELEEAKKEIQNLDKEHQENQMKKAIEQKLHEERAKLVVERHEHSERENKLKTLQAKNQSLIEENNNLSLKVQNLEQERFDFEQKLIRAREDVRIYSQTVSDLQSKIVQLDILTNQLQQEKEKVETTSCELERLRKSNEELMSDMSSCRNREAEMLAFTQKLTTKNVQLQSEFSAVEAKAAMLDSEHQRSEETVASLKSRVKSLEREVKEEQARRTEEVRLMARQLAESTTRVQSLHASIEDYKGEISVLRNKHATTVRELQRELQQHKKKLDQYELGGVGSGNGSLCHGSRTSSQTSLNNEPTTTNLHSATNHHQSTTNTFQVDVAPQALVDRIVRLQHEIARQKERIEFLEEHTAQLTAEIQKKSKLLQSYILREQAGALSSRSMDNNKAEVTKHGGIMASLYGSKLADDTMTLELSLEINHKLQAVLEDTLLKNITLKENIDTLGDEIARLSRQRINN